jgi:hypothetical protein
MTQPWFDENMFGALFGSIAGGVGGSLMGGWGGLVGWLAPKGRARGFIYGSWVVFMVLGAISLAFGLYALAVGQPYGIWYGPTLTGGLTLFLMSVLFPVVRKRYAEADARRMEAEAIRRA